MDSTQLFGDTAEYKFIVVKNFCKNSRIKTILGVIYRPPNLPFDPFSDKFDQLLAEINNRGALLYLAADFNINLLTHQEGPKARKFINILMSNNHFPLFSRPTRITNTSSTLIDNIITNDTRLLNYSKAHIL